MLAAPGPGGRDRSLSLDPALTGRNIPRFSGESGRGRQPCLSSGTNKRRSSTFEPFGGGRFCENRLVPRRNRRLSLKRSKFYSLAKAVPLSSGDGETRKLTEKQKKVYHYLQEQAGRPVPGPEILTATGVTAYVLAALVKKGVVECSLQEVPRDPFACFPEEAPVPTPARVSLNPDQAAALDRILQALDRPEPAGFSFGG